MPFFNFSESIEFLVSSSSSISMTRTITELAAASATDQLLLHHIHDHPSSFPHISISFSHNKNDLLNRLPSTYIQDNMLLHIHHQQQLQFHVRESSSDPESQEVKVSANANKITPKIDINFFILKFLD